MPDATVMGVVVLIATCRTISTTNACNVLDRWQQRTNRCVSQITANVQGTDSWSYPWTTMLTPSTTQAKAVDFTLSLVSDGNHHWYVLPIQINSLEKEKEDGQSVHR